MKKLIPLLVAFAAFSCGTAEKPKVAASTAATEKVTYAYPVRYSAEFKLTDPSRSQLVLELWKAFDNNDLDKYRSAFADSVVMEFPGAIFRGSGDQMFSMMKEHRAPVNSIQSKVEAIMSVNSTKHGDKGNWVTVWGSEKTTNKNGKVDSSRIHELWHFNEKGKIDLMSQFRQEYGK